MSDALLIALFAGVPALMAALGSTAAIVIAQLNAHRADKKADAIHVLVNSQMSEVTRQLAEAKQQIEALKLLLSEYGRRP